MTSFSRGCSVLAILAVGLMLVTGCTRVAPEPADEIEITQAMRDACPTLTDPVLDTFIMAVSGVRKNGLSEEDALQQWVTGCQNIPPDGNFQGDISSCEACMPVIVEEVYSAAEPE